MKARYALWLAMQFIIAPRYATMIRRIVRERMVPLKTGQWLDIGCGPRSVVAKSLSGTLIGVDCSVEMMHDTNRNGTIYVCGNATALPFATKSFDGILSFGLLHHLSDTDADRALGEMRRLIRPGGIVMIFDSVRPASVARRPLAALLRALDHGRYTRDEAALRRLLDRHGFHAGPRMTYSWTGLEELRAVVLSAPIGNSEAAAMPCVKGDLL
jgi:ubiquinone/menaquinone biosynthesis C-methylase UbiE